MIGLGESATIGGTIIHAPVKQAASGGTEPILGIGYSGGSPGYSAFQAQLEALQAELEATKTNPIPFTELEQRYLEQLNLELLYARKAYFGFVNHLRRAYNAPEGAWVLNNINVGFERIR